MPVVTPGPDIKHMKGLRRDGPDAVSLAKVLMTAIPESLRQIAATNVGAVSSILWEEFLDDKKPEWFSDLPWDIRSYLVQEFGPSTAALPSVPASATAVVSSTESRTSQASSSETEGSQISQSTGSPSSGSTLATSVITVSMSSIDIPVAAPTRSSTSTSAPAPTASPDSGLSKSQKIGIGVGVPLAIAGAAALALGCCFLLRRRRRSIKGSIPPSSPGFIPRFAFQEKSYDSLGQQHPLHRSNHQSTHDMDWDDDVVEYGSNGPPSIPQPIVTPSLYHTHSSNRARGKRTSYQSLQSVTEVSEPDEAISPIMPREGSQQQSSQRWSLIAPPIPMASQVKRKPLPTRGNFENSDVPNNAADLASQSLLRQTMGGNAPPRPNPPGNSPPRHSPNSYGQGITVTVSPIEERSSHNPFTGGHSLPRFGNSTEVTTPYKQDPSPVNPFTNDFSYVEDYGPEYHSGYGASESGLYGGNTNLSRYPEPKASKTEWPLRNGGPKRPRNKSPLWDRVYSG
ncbi:hypothetical protein BCR34DRAFT_601258 [Clohesyomyces aquaticus]|uniref:Uncharacterized protein n=1 Tax=Clohesyomyces aquaticus TaxID=1231657 RepID=A0A1Y1ZNS0_9PLEO|nr:hypothetical protein BCR34DRAFT_601258 [Clohesyomyces aquaticus]